MNPGVRRNACPTIARPMATGDGLLARLPPGGPMAPAVLAMIADAAARFGNGTVEVTARGSLQIRGLAPANVAPFAAALAEAGIRDARPAIVVPPLAGFDHGRDVRPLAAALRDAAAPLADRLAPKVSAVIDGGGGVTLDALDTDLRITVLGEATGLAIGGTAATARQIGFVRPDRTIDAATAVLRLMAANGARGHGLDAGTVIAATRAVPGAIPLRRPADPLSDHPLRDGTMAVGIALAFGQADTTTLVALCRAAAESGAAAIAPAPGRALLAIGISPAMAGAFRARAAALGFITATDDPRRAVAACPGAPACASGHLAARALAPAVARAAAPMLDGTVTLHLSGCAKGCARPGPATITITGTERGTLIATNDRAGTGVPAGPDIVAAVARIARETIDA